MHGSRTFCASACFFSAWIACVCGCARIEGGGGADEIAVAPAADATPAIAKAPDDSGTAPDSDPYLSALPIKSRSIGHTSYVLKLRLEGGFDAAFKPRSRLPRGDRRYKSEVAAYRLALAFGIENVPRAIPRSFAAPRLLAAFSTTDGAAEFKRRAIVDPDGLVRGALIPWVERYEVLPLEEATWRSKWERWLMRGGEPPPEAERRDARAVSTMVTFDYVTANWDRWSGGNIARDGATGTVLYVDNDGAFYDPPPESALARQLALIRRVARFSRSFIRSLRALDDKALREAIGEESPGVPLLMDAAIAGIAARRKVVMDLVEERISRAGEAATLAFE